MIRTVDGKMIHCLGSLILEVSSQVDDSVITLEMISSYTRDPGRDGS